MHRNIIVGLTLAASVLGFTAAAFARTDVYNPNRARGPVRTAITNPHIENRVHDKGRMCMNLTNYGYFGNSDPSQDDALTNPCPPENWAEQCEYPCGGDINYLYQAGLWIGALIVEEGFETKRVSVGVDGWLNPSVNEFWPGEGANDGIRERSTRPGYTNCLGVLVSDSTAVSDQDFIAVMADTLRDDFWLTDDPIDGAHRPLGLKITQTSYAFSQAFAEDFILIDYEVENIASNFLKNVYVGLYVDADVGDKNLFNEHTDDICGFRRYTREESAGGQEVLLPIDVAWIADNDGRRSTSASGPLTCPNVVGTRVIRGPNPRLETSFNWWISNGDAQLDFGPFWDIHCDDPRDPLYWNRTLGTPMGDEHKYQILSNGEFDPDQLWVSDLGRAPKQYIIGPDGEVLDSMAWATCDPSEQQDDIANGFDTRYLLSWGPLGIRDYQDQSGRWIYRLNPGEKFNMTIAYVGGENFHDPTHQQRGNQVIDSTLFSFADLELNARWAKDVYDNRGGTDTPQWDWGNDHDPVAIDNDDSQGDGILDTGDGWFGEDVGADGLYTETPSGFRPGIDSVAVYYWKGTINGYQGVFAGYYKGPDADGSEGDGLISDVFNENLFRTTGGFGSEDNILPFDLVYQHPRYRSWDMGWMSGNGALDQGDGLPDFTGPPPPRLPALLHCVENTSNSAAHLGGVVRVNTESPAGDCFVGGLGYELKSSQVVLRWSRRASEDSSYRDPFSRVQDFEGYRIHRGTTALDTSFSLIAEFDLIDFAYFSATDSMMTIPVVTTQPDTLPQDTTILEVPGTLKPVGNNIGLAGIILDDSTYQFFIDAHALAPLYYSVTSFDFGDPKSGLGPLATRPTANAVLLAPAGTAKEPVKVVPNPYRAYEDYTQANLGISWENQNDGTKDFYSQQDRRLEFINLPEKCLIRIFTTAGDLVQIVPHNTDGDKSAWASMSSERWDLNSRNRQQVVSGIYLYSVENLTDGHGYEIETGKFVIIR